MTGSERQKIFFVSGMWCTSCAKSIRENVSKIEGVRTAEVNYASKLLLVEPDGRSGASDLDMMDREILAKVDRIGFGIKRLPEGWILDFRENLERETRERLPWTFIAVVWFLAMWSSMLAFARYAGGGLSQKEAFYLAAASSAFGLPAILIGIKPYAESGWRALRFNRRMNLDLFIFVGGLAAIFISVLSFFQDQAISYADSGSMIIALLLLTKKIENTVVKKVTSSILSELHPGKKNVTVLKTGTWQLADVSQIRKGDRLRFKAQDTISMDGTLAVASATINAHLLSGESMPLIMTEGDDLFAGAIALTDLEMITQRPMGFRRIDAWAEAALTGQNRNSPFTRVFSRIENSLTSVALTGALLLTGLALIKGADPVQAMESFFIGILIFCPCLFASIIPLAKQIAHLTLLRTGTLLSRSEALLDLCRIQKFYFDKTGTLEAISSTFEPFEGSDSVSPYLRELATRSSHPVLKGLGPLEGGGRRLRHFEEIPGQGVSAITENDDRLLIGQASYLKEKGVPEDARWDHDFPAIACNGKLVGQILVKKIYDEKSKSVLRRLLAAYPNLGIEIISGDPVSRAGLEFTEVDPRISYRGGLSPDEKAALIGERSAFIGDGLNDTLALAKADVSFRIGKRAAGFAPVDFHLQVPSLAPLLAVMKYARKYRKVLLQTGAAAFIYNLVAFTLAALGRFSPLGAVLAMLGSFFVLLLSALRLMNIPLEEK